MEVEGVDFHARETGSGTRVECTRCHALVARRWLQAKRDTSDEAYELEIQVLQTLQRLELGHEEGDVCVREGTKTPGLTIYFWDIERMREFVKALQVSLAEGT